MDEAREAREELATIQRDDEDAQREHEAARREWADEDGLSWAEHVTAETWRWSR